MLHCLECQNYQPSSNSEWSSASGARGVLSAKALRIGLVRKQRRSSGFTSSVQNASALTRVAERTAHSCLRNVSSAEWKKTVVVEGILRWKRESCRNLEIPQKSVTPNLPRPRLSSVLNRFLSLKFPQTLQICSFTSPFALGRLKRK